MFPLVAGLIVGFRHPGFYTRCKDEDVSLQQHGEAAFGMGLAGRCNRNRVNRSLRFSKGTCFFSDEDS
jgi:hypothetical protein